MLGNNRMETTYAVLCRFDVETTKKNPRGKIIDISSILKVESTLKFSASNRCHNFHVDSPFKVEEISTKFPRRISASNQWRINKDVSIGLLRYHQTPRKCCSITKWSWVKMPILTDFGSVVANPVKIEQ